MLSNLGTTVASTWENGKLIAFITLMELARILSTLVKSKIDVSIICTQNLKMDDMMSISFGVLNALPANKLWILALVRNKASLG